MNRKNIIVGLIALFLQVHVIAQNGKSSIEVSELKQEMLEKTVDVKSVSCDFEQNKHMEYLDAVITSTGKLVFDKKNRVRWEYQNPFEYLIVINNGKFSIMTDGRINEYDIKSNPMFSQISELIISSINGSVFTNDEFNVKAYKTPNQYEIILQPVNEEMKKVINKIKLIVDRSDFSVDQVVMYERENDYTEIKFTNKRFNEVLSDRTFSIQ